MSSVIFRALPLCWIKVAISEDLCIKHVTHHPVLLDTWYNLRFFEDGKYNFYQDKHQHRCLTQICGFPASFVIRRGAASKFFAAQYLSWQQTANEPQAKYCILDHLSPSSPLPPKWPNDVHWWGSNLGLQYESEKIHYFKRNDGCHFFHITGKSVDHLVVYLAEFMHYLSFNFIQSGHLKLIDVMLKYSSALQNDSKLLYGHMCTLEMSSITLVNLFTGYHWSCPAPAYNLSIPLLLQLLHLLLQHRYCIRPGTSQIEFLSWSILPPSWSRICSRGCGWGHIRLCI